jgi:endo-1,4-beta-xylanase
MTLRGDAAARLPCALALMLVSLVLGSALLGTETADARKLTAKEALRLAAKHDRRARSYDKRRRRELGRARRIEKAIARAGAGARRTLVGAFALPKAALEARRLRRRASRHRRRAKKYAVRARWHRREAVRLRRLAAGRSRAPAAPRRAPIPLGAAVAWDEFESDARLGQTFLRHFDQMTPENELKWQNVHPGILTWRFSVADEMVDWARSHGKRVRGHTLIWSNQNPPWVEQGVWTRDTLLKVMKNHINTTMGHFRGRVHEWDVVNEAIDPHGNWVRNVWYRVIGPDYVDWAFRYARQADPGARLYYNETGLDGPDHPHSRGVLSMLRRLRSRGVPVDAVGMQGHVSTRFRGTPTGLTDLMHEFTALGLAVAITEMDVRTDGDGTLSQRREAQRVVYRDYARACRLEPRCTSFTTWGISDAYSWWEQPELAPLLFDGAFKPKPAFHEVQDWIRTG